ncbi:plasma membrane ATPase 1-like [Dorcoceras hygrometricum]|uniref:Plasma membrane ATPase 1-like n=1 Tax=Dorcoceras hygrometricum TaxID=472368 RepID=A0A2Z7BVT9_9LAMI|nr:plasma membrane ATPase 1-like [Dorcoceras hygrometricum]
MRIRPPEFETSICDAKYHVSLSTRSVLGKCVYLVTLVMSLFDLQDVCIAIGSIATLDLPMVVDLIGIYGLKGPCCTLTTTNWFLQALSVIPRGSWGDVARRFTMIRWAAAAARLRRKFVFGQFDEENPFVLISSVLLVQADEGVSFLVVDRIGDIYRNLPRRADVIVTTVGARHKCQQGSGFEPPIFETDAMRVCGKLKILILCFWKFGSQILRLPFFQIWKASTRRFDPQSRLALGLIHCPKLNS